MLLLPYFLIFYIMNPFDNVNLCLNPELSKYITEKIIIYITIPVFFNNSVLSEIHHFLSVYMLLKHFLCYSLTGKCIFILFN